MEFADNLFATIAWVSVLAGCFAVGALISDEIIEPWLRRRARNRGGITK